MIRVGVIGYGYWGPNIVRNFHGQDNTRVEMLCDKNLHALARANRNYPSIEVTTDPNEVLKSPNVDAVAGVSPVWTHNASGHAALAHCKHLCVQTPFTSTSA